ncbi:hypothetical protein CIRG_00983 [Coccidioides immitis RMSCC 2394]|uniref:Uncharacterized protein n=1 Tax=Coccidioides immitis RMSCC 2394 TaxID=404692 RepID=A0A0J6XXA6_COCIT|nr:hypothetical protein CIRG_00983 [Coccidioides immitis RMSCC 2394]
MEKNLTDQHRILLSCRGGIRAKPPYFNSHRIACACRRVGEKLYFTKHVLRRSSGECLCVGSAFARFLGQLFTRIVSRCISLQRIGTGRSRWDSCSKSPRGAEGWKSDPDIRQLSDVPGVAASPFGPTFLHRSSRRRRHKARDGRVRNDEEMRNIKLDLVLGWASGEPAHDSQFFGFVGVQRSTRKSFGEQIEQMKRSQFEALAISRRRLKSPLHCAVNPGPTPPYFRAAKACAQCYLPARSRSFSPRKVNDSAPGGYKGKVLFIMNDRGWLAAVIAELYWWAFDVPSRGISSISLYFFTDTAPETSLDTANGEEKNYPTANVLEAARRNERVPVRVQHQAAKVCLHPARKLPVLPLTLQPSVIAMNRSQIVLAQNFLLTQSTSARNGLWRSCYASISSTCLHATRSFST